MKEAILEPFFRKLRINQIDKHIPDSVSVCDLGCGPEFPLLKELSPRISVGYGFDPLAVPFSSSKIVVKKMDIASGVDLGPSSVDVVTMLAVIEHIKVEDIGRVISEAFRVLKPGGKLLATTPTPMSKSVLEFLSYKLHIVSRREIEEHQHYYKEEELRNLLDKAGFQSEHTVIKKFELGFNWFLRAEK